MVIRKQYREYESSILTPYAMHGSDTAGRVYDEPSRAYRSPFQRDRDRIIHSKAFRRMMYKTQVFVFHESDHFRTRMTHTIEVTQIGRSLARALYLNEDLTEAIGLAHDLGHTPFGHAGESALNTLMEAHGGFEHNAHSLRVVDHLEERYPNIRGLNCTYELREGIAKHRSSYDTPQINEFDPSKRATLEAQVINIADAIAYNNHDLDDGIRSGIIALDDLEAIPIWADTSAAVRKEHPGASERTTLHRTISQLINDQISDTILTTQDNLEVNDIQSVEDVRCARDDLVQMSREMAARVKKIQNYLYDNLYFHPQVVRMAEKAKRIISELFDAYLSNPRQLPIRYKRRLDDASAHRVIADYIAGMTDRYAQDEYRRFFFPLERV